MIASSRTFIALGVLVALIAGGAWWWNDGRLSSPLSFVEGESITEWNFDGPYRDGGALEAQARAEIERFKGLLGNSKDYTDYTLYIGIAGQHELLGEGRETYEYLLRALRVDAEKTGLAWHNLGVLYARLGAPKTALLAYERAKNAQSHIITYHTQYLSYFTDTFPDDRVALETAFAASEESLGALPDILRIRAAWLSDTGRIEEAIAEWEKIRTLTIPQARSGVDEEIARLRGKL